MTNKMLNPISKSYKITLKTGLHIGGSKDSLKIGGIDSCVVKNPLTGAPYIPGSSIKGKMRALLEMVDYSSLIDEKGNVISDESCPISKAFGCAGNTKIASKIIFEDFVLTNEFNKKYEELKSDFFEDKAENSVPRFLKGSANPRHIERIPSGVEFEGKIILLPAEGEYGMNENDLNKILDRGIELLNATFLGGGGSRGNGRIKITEL